MLNNKNNITSNLSILRAPFSSYGESWSIKLYPVYSLIMLLGIGICLAAASWQFNKAQFFMTPIAQVSHMQGEYLNQYTHYLDNQTLNGKAGYGVITPFKYEQSIYLVNRGFIAYQNRDVLPRVQPVSGVVKISGYSKNNVKPLLLNDSLQDPLNLRIQFINAKHFQLMLNQPVAQKIFHIESGAGLMTPFPKSQPYLSHHRHMGYAIQWGLLAIAGIFIWLVASIKRGENS